MTYAFKQSPNCGSRRGYKPDMIVCHITEGSYAGAVSWLCNKASQASAHFVVSRKGEVTQLVPIEKMAWANGTYTSCTKASYYGNSTLATVRKRRTNANYYTVSIELEGTTVSTAGRLTDPQYDALITLIKYIRTYVKSVYHIDIPFNRSSLVGHNEISPKSKPYCPGVYFPWGDIIASLNKREPAVSSTKIELIKDGKTSIHTVYRVFYHDTNYLKLRDVCNLANVEVGYTTRPSIKTSKPSTSGIVLDTDHTVKECKIDVIYNGTTKTVGVNSILMDGTNYVKIRDVGHLIGATIGFNSNTGCPIMSI